MKNRSPMEDQIDCIFDNAKDIIKNNTGTDNVDDNVKFLLKLSEFINRQARSLNELCRLMPEKAEEVEEVEDVITGEVTLTHQEQETLTKEPIIGQEYELKDGGGIITYIGHRKSDRSLAFFRQDPRPTCNSTNSVYLTGAYFREFYKPVQSEG